MPLKIFYLDDEEALCSIFNDYFASEDVVITTFVDPAAAIKAIRENQPDLLFIDYRLPGTTGDEIAKMLDPKLPKFLITGDIHVITEYKFEKIFFKPYDDKVIRELISGYVSAKKSA